MARPLKLPLSSNPGRFRQDGDPRLVNVYVEKRGEAGKQDVAHYAVPGLVSWADVANGGVGRGLFVVDNATLIAVSGQAVVRCDPFGATTFLGGMLGTKHCTFARNLKSPTPEVVIVGDSQSKVWDGGASLATITDPDLLPANSVDFISRYILFGHSSGRFSWSAIDDATSIAALSYAVAEGRPDGLNRLKVVGDQIWLLGEETVEVWALTDSVDDPFARVDATYINLGCIARNSVVQVGQKLAWIANDFTVRLAQGYDAEIISSHAVSTAIEAVADPNSIEASVATNREQRAKIADSMKQLTELASSAETQNDQQWAQTVQMFRQQGMNVPAQFDGPQGRQLAISQARNTMETLKRELVQAQTGQAKASAAASNAQAATMPAHGDLYTAQAEQARAHARAFDAQADRGNEGKIPQGYRSTADGNLEAIPGGPADTKINEKRQSDFASMQYLTQSLDNLAKSANQVMTHSGLDANFGMYGMVPNRPGSDAADADALLRTLKTQGAFATLQDMRNASKTGGALGAVSDKETAMLQQAIASLEKSQSAPQVKKNLQGILDFVEQSKARIRAAYDDHWKNNGAAARQAATPPPRLPQAQHGQAIDEARQAIARGASKDAVIQRLRQLGIDPGGL